MGAILRWCTVVDCRVSYWYGGYDYDEDAEPGRAAVQSARGRRGELPC
eukprot:COSAG02_NODE_7901_length_2798_cov_4.107447_6_plen_48_part_00